MTAEPTRPRGTVFGNGLHPSRIILLLMAAYLIGNSLNLALNVRTAKGAQTLVSSDSGQYLAIAQQFLGGNFSMDYLREVPHRQPLYPLLLAAAMKLGNGNLFFLGVINAVAMTLAIGSVYFGVLRFFRSQAVAAVSAFCVACNPFMWRTASARLLTEPLYALILIWVIIAFLQYLRERKVVWILLGSLFAGLDYLTRPNGVFDAAAFLGVLFLAELVLLNPSGVKKQPFFGRAWPLIPNYLCAVLVLIVVTTPAWIPRLVYFGDPLFHGYLTNFLWVDTYRYAHDFGEKFASYTWQDYASTHNLFDVVGRVIHGLWNVSLKIPIGNEKVPILFLLSVAGIWTAVRRGPNEYRFLLLFFVVQLFPFIWTNLANPTARVPYGSTLPFLPFFAACFLARFAVQLDAALGFGSKSTQRDRIAS
jgi:Dolichyl-phosphate-mannose-protein mannosyltransferase